MPFKASPIAERLAKGIERTEGCWLWKGTRNRRGYGVITLAPHHRYGIVHRVMWELHNGPIPKGIHVCHHCDNPPCARPDHLFLGTAGDNVRDCKAKGRLRPHNSLKTHCKRGHKFTIENTYRTKDGRRDCRACWPLRYAMKPHLPRAS